MFFGCKIKDNKNFTFQPTNNIIHISQACLGGKPDESKIYVKLEVNGLEYSLCVLQKNVIESFSIDHLIAWGKNNPKALTMAATKKYPLSELFNTSYNNNNGNDRVYRWGYLAVRFMLENHKDKIDEMLTFTRKGDYPRYQALVSQWGTSMDAEFQAWLTELAAKNQ